MASALWGTLSLRGALEYRFLVLLCMPTLEPSLPTMGFSTSLLGRETNYPPNSTSISSLTFRALNMRHIHLLSDADCEPCKKHPYLVR